ncbi:MAG TPA: DapH/DapD/GlmU-related protein [Acidimicrobiia bacterium]|jgi:acetyltransferase-like isoleucine patch superfamily enzyme|nr:DapH/DapD/GlmU-related protein [Acidimicrobiia bacterium]
MGEIDGETAPGQWERRLEAAQVVAGDVIRNVWARIERLGTIGPRSRRARAFRRFGDGSAICFPVAALYGEEYIELGAGCIIGPYCSLSAGVMPGQVIDHSPVVTIGDRVLIGKGSGVVAHHTVEIGDDVFTGHHVYITDANHGYEDRTLPIGKQFAPTRPVRIGSGSWLGHGTVVLPGSDIGRNVVVGAGSVVAGPLPDFSVAVGNPARVIRRHLDGQGWVRVDPAAPSTDQDPGGG